MHKTEDIAFPRKNLTVQPKLLISLVAILAFLGIVGGYIEISQSRKDVMALLHKEAETVSDALSVSAENAVQAYGEFEAYIENHLFNTAMFLRHLERENALSRSNFETLMRESGVTESFYVSTKGEIQGFAYPNAATPTFRPGEMTSFIEPLFVQQHDRISGFMEDREGQVHFAVALRSTAQKAWILCASPTVLIDLRKRIGLGRIIQDIGENEEIAYIVLQDEKGIISATRNVGSMPSIQHDSFLQKAVSTGELMTRVTDFSGQEVLEAVKPLQIEGETLGLIRDAHGCYKPSSDT